MAWRPHGSRSSRLVRSSVTLTAAPVKRLDAVTWVAVDGGSRTTCASALRRAVHGASATRADEPATELASVAGPLESGDVLIDDVALSDARRRPLAVLRPARTRSP